MRSFIRIILAAALATAAGTASAALTSTVTVRVNNEASVGIGSVTVAAIQWGMNGPSTHTQVGLTNSAGNVTFYNILLNTSYSFYVSSHGYSPSITDQFNDPEYNQNRHIWNWEPIHNYSTFTLTSGLAGVGIITQSFTNASPDKVLFGGLYNMHTQMQGASGLVMTDGSGDGTLVVENVPFALANTYNIGLYDPELNRGIGRNVMSDLGDGSPEYPGVEVKNYNGGFTLDFDKSIPPAKVENEIRPGNTGGASGASVEGVVYEVGYPTSTLAWAGIGVKACMSGMDWNGWANTDENGRFQFYGLTPGVTYYFNVMGGCAWTQNGPGACLESYASPQYGAQEICGENPPSLNANDLLYVSSDVAYHSIKLNRMPPGNGEIKICIKSVSGLAIPNSGVGLNPDWSPWPADGESCRHPDNFNVYSSTNFINNPGYANTNTNAGADGCTTLTGLPSGNYSLFVWTPFSQNNNGSSPYNAGPDGTFTAWSMGSQMEDWRLAHCKSYGVDDYRISITSWTTPTMHVYDSSGAVVTDGSVAISSITYLVETGGNISGEVKGTLTFPNSVNLANTPIVITLYGQCNGMGPCPAGNFTAVSGSGQTIPYSINVSSGFAYYMNVNGVGWGRVRRGGGDDSVHLEASSSVIVNMDFAPAGTVTGTVYKPDGTILTPSNNQWISVNVNSENGYSYTQLEDNGTFTLTSVLPGTSQISVYISGSGSSESYAMPSPQPTVNVVAGSTATVNIRLVTATRVGVALDMTKLPDATVIRTGWDHSLGFKAMPVTAGKVLKGETIAELFFGKGDDSGEFRFSTATLSSDNNSPCGPGWPGGFCSAAIASPAVYDFYLLRSGDFGNMSEVDPNDSNIPYPHFTLISSSKNVVVDTAHCNQLFPASMMEMQPGVVHSTVVLVNLTPPTDMSSRGNATLAGTVGADNFFRQADYDSLGGDFEEFIKYLPVVSLYDSNGSFAAAGIVLPSPQQIVQAEQNDLFNQAFAAGYTQFSALLNTLGSIGFQIRGLAPSACYTAVVTTPNYPPYQTRTCLGVNGSTTMLAIDLDSAVGAGATVQGVVTSTAVVPVKLPNVTVTMTGEAVGVRTAITDSSGTYRFEGLAPGSVRLNVSVDGYAANETEEDLVGSNSYTKNFALTAAGGSISGTVYSQKLPYAKMQAGAKIVAYNDSYNGTHPDSPLPLIKTQTGSDGTYRLTGLIPGDVYKIFLKVAGKCTLSQTTVTLSGNLAGIDFTMLPKPLDIEMFAKKGAEYYEFTVLNPQDFKTGEARWSASPYNAGASTELNLTQLSSGEMSGKIPLSALSPGITYVLRGSATSYALKNVTKELLFGKDYKGNTRQNIDAIILGDDTEDDTGRKNNEMAMDKSGDDPSGITFPPGAVQAVSTAAVPTCSFKGEGIGSSSVADKVAALGADAFAGDLYTVSLTSITANDNKSIELTLAYDKSTADLGDLSVARYNDATGSWEQLSGIATVNPLKGTVKVKLRTLASVLSVKPGAATPQVNRFDGRQYKVAAAGSGSSSGTFAVIRPSVVGDSFTGSKMKVFNYPNPFSLKAKTVTAHNHDAGNLGTLATNGTFIHVEVPAANSGPCHIRIYTLAGELVNDLNSSCVGGQYNYFEWNGHNKAGQEVANGVYYGVVELSGKKPSLEDATFKMVVIK